MTELINKWILLIVSVVIGIVGAGMAMDIIPMIIVVISSALLSYVDSFKFKTAILCVFIAITFQLPLLILFLPLVAYDFFCTTRQWFSLLTLIPIFASITGTIDTDPTFYSRNQDNRYTLFLLLFVLGLFTYVIKEKTVAYSKLKVDFEIFRDSNKEFSLKLEQQKNTLIEKQDYEIKVATLNERNRIARDIHDNVGHLLSRCLLMIGALLSVSKDASAKEGLVSVKDTLSQAMDSIRNSVHDLHHDAIDLHAQIQDLVEKFHFCPILLEYDMSDQVDKQLKYCFIAVVKEALSNIVKHSNATEGNIRIREFPAFYQLIIQDNGDVKNYDPENGIGLNNISERVQKLNGYLRIQTERGFVLFISIPKNLDKVRTGDDTA